MKQTEFVVQRNCLRLADKPRRTQQPAEYKVVAMRECPSPGALRLCNEPAKAAAYWDAHIKTHPFFTPECEMVVVLYLTTRRRVRGHSIIGMGTLDSVLVHPREVFRGAILMGASVILLMHNHPSGDATPSDADIAVTRDLIRAGQIIKIEVVDHVIIADEPVSLEKLGYFDV